MCCQIPPYEDLRPRRTKSVAEQHLEVRAWASFAAGIVLLSLSLASAAWIAARFA
jgi:hypothetical protein